jgi:hypothetical protein
MILYFQFNQTTIQIIHDKDLCFIFNNGKPMWAGNKEELINILQSIHNGKE